MFRVAAVALLVAAVGVSAGRAAQTLDDVRERGQLRCGLASEKPGLAEKTEAGDWSGLDADICRALAAAALGDATKVTFVALAGEPALAALAAGDVDVIARYGAGARKAAELKLRFTALAFVKGLGLMVPAAQRVGNLRDLEGATICFEENPDRRGMLGDFARRSNVTWQLRGFADLTVAGTALFANECQALLSDRVDLAALRAREGAGPAEFEILPDLFSKDPTGPFVRDDDGAWLELVRWSVFALIEGEERGIGSDNVEQIRTETKDPAVQRFLGVIGSLGKSLDLEPDWVVSILGQVGNYGEIYARNLGADSPLRLERGPNALWRDGGLLQAMAFQ